MHMVCLHIKTFDRKNNGLAQTFYPGDECAYVSFFLPPPLLFFKIGFLCVLLAILDLTV